MMMCEMPQNTVRPNNAMREFRCVIMQANFPEPLPKENCQ